MILKIVINQETKGGQEYVKFGQVSVNLSEYAGIRKTEEKRFLIG